MNIQLSRAARWAERAAHAMVCYGARFAHRFILAVGLIVILMALVLWLSPVWRNACAAQLRLWFSVTAPPDFRPLLADHSHPGQIRYPLNSGVLTLELEHQSKRDMTKFRKQDRIADYLARRYRVARAPVGHLVKAAFSTGQEFDLDPLLLLAVMAIESRFNPYAESGVGAQGLMQVMPKVHLSKFDYFGGPEATLDPLVNLKVGALILKECIARGGSLTEGLRRYVGALPSSESSYAAKVLAERKLLRDVAHGLNVSIYAARTPEARTVQARKKLLKAYATIAMKADRQVKRELTLLNASN